jgi:hypothetical protein
MTCGRPGGCGHQLYVYQSPIPPPRHPFRLSSAFSFSPVFQYNSRLLPVAGIVWFHGYKSSQAIIPSITITVGTTVVARVKTQHRLVSWLLGVLVRRHNHLRLHHHLPHQYYRQSPIQSWTLPPVSAGDPPVMSLMCTYILHHQVTTTAL